MLLLLCIDCHVQVLSINTPIEVWSGSHASYDGIHIFGCLAYYHIRNE